MEKKNVVFTKDGAKVGVKEVSTESYTDKTQRAFVKTWNAAQDGYALRQPRGKLCTNWLEQFARIARLVGPKVCNIIVRLYADSSWSSAARSFLGMSRWLVIASVSGRANKRAVGVGRIRVPQVLHSIRPQFTWLESHDKVQVASLVLTPRL